MIKYSQEFTLRFSLPFLLAAALPAAPLSNIVQLDPGGTAALDASGRVFSWGPQPAALARTPVIYPTPRLIAESAAFKKVAGAWVLRNDGTVCTLHHSSGSCATIPGLSNITDIMTNTLSGNALGAGGTLWQMSFFAPFPSVYPILENVAAIGPNVAIRDNGTAWALNVSPPLQIQGLSSVTTAALNGANGIAIREDGSVWSWIHISTSPSPVAGLPAPASALAAGANHVLVLLTNGTLWTWGDNAHGQLGNGTNNPSAVPIRVPGFAGGIRSLAAGETHSAVLMNDGTLRTWGGNVGGELGIGSAAQPIAVDPVPAPVPGLSSVRAVAAGNGFSLALGTDGSVWSWGHAPRLGDCSALSRDRAVASSVTGASAISTRDSHALALLTDGRVSAWGSNSGHQLGDGTTVDRCAPAPVPGVTGMAAVAAGDTHSLALKSDGAVWAWGDFGNQPPAARPSLAAVQSIAAGQFDSFAVLADGSAMRWHRTSGVPFAVAGLPAITHVSAGFSSFALAIDTAGGLWRLASPAPVKVHYDSGVQSIASDIPGVVIKTDGTAWTFDSSSLAQPPQQLRGLTGVQSMAVSPLGRHYLALMTDGTVRSWGSNSLGQLGRGLSGLSFNRASPVTVPSLPVIPTPAAMTPATGRGPSQTFTFNFEHNGGAANIAIANVLINNAIDGRNACYVAFLPTGPSSGNLVLVNDAGQAGGPFAGSLAIPASGQIANSQCTIRAAGSSVQTTATRLTLTLDIAFAGSFAGGRAFYLAGRDNAGGNTGWVPQGAWTVPYPLLQTQSILSVSLGASSNGLVADIAFVHTLGADNFEIINLLINQAVEGARACYLAYLPATGSVYLVNDLGEAGGPFAGSVSLGAANRSVSNSQCSIFGDGSSAAVSGNTLTLHLPFTLNDRTNPWIVYAAARDRLGNNTGWQPIAVTGPE